MTAKNSCPGCNRYNNPFYVYTLTPNIKAHIGRQTGLVICGVFYSFYVLEADETNYFRYRESLRCGHCGFEFDEVTEGPVALENLTVNHE